MGGLEEESATCPRCGEPIVSEFGYAYCTNCGWCGTT